MNDSADLIKYLVEKENILLGKSVCDGPIEEEKEEKEEKEEE